MNLLNKKILAPGISELLGGSSLHNASIENYYDLIILIKRESVKLQQNR